MSKIYVSKTLALSLLLVSLGSWAETLYQTQDQQLILDAARQIMREDVDAALISIDRNGQPRARTVTTSPPEADMTVWVATKPNTRKVQQIANNPRVTLYFSVDDAFSYVSIMGTAHLHTDLETITNKNFYADEALKQHWPNFPNDYLLIEIKPTWIEVEGHGITGHSGTWQPQGVELRDQ